MKRPQWMAAPQMGIQDGATEAHKSNLTKLLLRDYDASPDLFPTYHLPKLIEAAIKLKVICCSDLV